MQIAVFSDVHANLPALEVVLDDIERDFPDAKAVVSLGDLVGRGPHPNEVMDLCRARKVDMVMGNYEDAIAFGRLGSGADFPHDLGHRHDQYALEWTANTLTKENLRVLEALPRDLRIYTTGAGGRIKRNTGDVRQSEQARTLFSRLAFGSLLQERRVTGTKRIREMLLLHGSPRALNEFIREDTALSIATRLAEDARADLVITGHSGMSYSRVVDETTFVGVGSVSGAQARPGQAEYVVLNVDTGVEMDVRVARYDVDRFQVSLEAAGLPTHWADI